MFDYEANEMWMLQIRIHGVRGDTLWTTFPDGADMVLGIDGAIILANSRPGLANLLNSDVQTSLSFVQGYPAIREYSRLHPSEWSAMQPWESYDFARAQQILDKPGWERWRLSTCANVLNHWNLLTDLLLTVREEIWPTDSGAKSLTWDFLDELTFMTIEVRDLLNRFDQDTLRAAFRDGVSRAGRKLLLLK